MAKKAKKAAGAKRATRAKAKKRPAGKRDLVKSKIPRYAKRTAKGRFKEIDNVGRSQTANRRTKAKKKAKSGFGDA